MKFDIFSIKWRLMAISILMVTTPTVILGLMSFYTMEANAIKEARESLTHSSIYWQNMTL
ncbi:MAG: hypothetical protein KZQ94_22540 [Candidatus Thiodiazotropha sp. (ex Troendleina suluensis)]|nr:hypothetical protein [Candidatus Thiodiazotropha sp. (ex Troendleina suluensis)]